ncbi:MAG: hypothetical protein LBU51_06340 [Bacteroidales bacterium]|jgi:hypothetical protein|nr:hypothetical protein [Bacteroidales bacterium]
MRNIIAILALFVCMDVCLGQHVIGIDTDFGVDTNVAGNSDSGGLAPWSRDPNNNIVNIRTGTNIRFAYGAYMDSASAVIVGAMTGNEVNVYGGDCRAIAGAYAEDVESNVNKNEVTINGGKIVGEVCGGAVEGTGKASENKVTITGGDVGGDVIGGMIRNGIASKNVVTVNGVTIGGEIFGGRVIGEGNAENNTVMLTNATVISQYRGGVCGGCVRSVDARESKGNAENNTVTLDNITTNQHLSVYGGCATNGSANGNKVTITGGSVGRNVCGGYARNGSANGNKVTITGGSVGGNVCGGEAMVIDGNNRNAENNTVMLTNATVGGDVYGGNTASGSANGNTVTINGGEISGGSVCGGWSSDSGDAINNTITISGTPVFGPTVTLYGGRVTDKYKDEKSKCKYNALKGNTLNIVETKGIVVDGISNFEDYNFYFPADIKSEDTILTSKTGVHVQDVNNGVKLYIKSAMNIGDSVVLIRSQEIPQECMDIDRGERYTRYGCWLHDNQEINSYRTWGLVRYKLHAHSSAGSDTPLPGSNTPCERCFRVTLDSKEVKEEAITFSGGYGAGVLLINQGMDCILSKMEEAESLLVGRKGEIGVFFGGGGGKSKYNSLYDALRIDMEAITMLGGVGKVVAVRGNALIVGVFAEHGSANSDICFTGDSRFSSRRHDVEEPLIGGGCAKGTSEYVGGGVLGRYNFYEDEFSGKKIYGEAVLRGGKVSNSFKEEEDHLKDLVTWEGLKYKTKTTYEGYEVGGGYKHKAGEKLELDWSLKYIFACQNGEDVELANGETIKFKNAKSGKIRLGGRVRYVGEFMIKPYVGIWGYGRTDGVVKAEVQNGEDSLRMPDPNFGAEAMCEVGASGKIWKLTVDINLQKYVGARDGYTGMLKIKYAFGKDAHICKPQLKDEKKETAEPKKEALD